MFKGDLEEDMEGDSKGYYRGDFKQNLEGNLLSNSGQVKSRSGLVHVCFSLQLKFNSLELDSQVGRLVYYVDNINELTQIDLVECEHILCDAPSGFPPLRV